jgi:hypothetical protein
VRDDVGLHKIIGRVLLTLHAPEDARFPRQAHLKINAVQEVWPDFLHVVPRTAQYVRDEALKLPWLECVYRLNRWGLEQIGEDGHTLRPSLPAPKHPRHVRGSGTIYLTANSILLGATAILIQQSGLKDYLALALAILVAGAGMSLSISWLRLIRRYQVVIRRRFRMLETIELRPDFEWPIQIYIQQQKDPPKPRSGGFSALEAHIPVIVLATYALLILATAAFKAADLMTLLHTWGVLSH